MRRLASRGASHTHMMKKVAGATSVYLVKDATRMAGHASRKEETGAKMNICYLQNKLAEVGVLGQLSDLFADVGRIDL